MPGHVAGSVAVVLNEEKTAGAYVEPRPRVPLVPARVLDTHVQLLGTDAVHIRLPRGLAMRVSEANPMVNVAMHW